MKKPLLNLEQRQLIRLGTTQGAFIELNIALKHLFRELEKPITKLLNVI
jgi:hypothetical protein